jgi:hypothetical protein
MQGARVSAELVAVGNLEQLFESEVVSRMLGHEVKRSRTVGNLNLALLRPGLQIEEAVRSMADVDLSLQRGLEGIRLEAHRPSFAGRWLAPDPLRGAPSVLLRKKAPPPAEGGSPRR